MLGFFVLYMYWAGENNSELIFEVQNIARQAISLVLPLQIKVIRALRVMSRGPFSSARSLSPEPRALPRVIYQPAGRYGSQNLRSLR